MFESNGTIILWRRWDVQTHCLVLMEPYSKPAISTRTTFKPFLTSAKFCLWTSTGRSWTVRGATVQICITWPGSTIISIGKYIWSRTLYRWSKPERISPD
uniref:Uncharacterized protein n=1 Tax=Cacopsylla melanoneura TaxID=428564 RepID=A0A8D8LP22_9HEMI